MISKICLLNFVLKFFLLFSSLFDEMLFVKQSIVMFYSGVFSYSIDDIHDDLGKFVSAVPAVD